MGEAAAEAGCEFKSAVEFLVNRKIMSPLLFAIVVGLIIWLRHLLLLKDTEEDVLHRIYTVYTCFLLVLAALLKEREPNA